MLLVAPLLFAAARLSAQLPGVPTAPGAFVRPGLAVAANVGREADGALERTDAGALRTTARQTYGGALGYAPSSARWQLSIGAAAQQWGAGFKDPALALGARAAVPLLRGERFGALVFAGAGVARARFEPVAGVEDGDDPSLRQFAGGASAGVRGALAGRAWALSLAPQFVQYRLAVGDDAVSSSRLRVAALAEAGLTSRLGLSIAYEDGARAASGEPGPKGSTIGVALSFALRGR